MLCYIFTFVRESVTGSHGNMIYRLRLKMIIITIIIMKKLL